MGTDKGFEQTHRQLDPKYSNLIQIPENTGENILGQNPETIPENPLNTRIGRRNFLRNLGIGAGLVAGAIVLNSPAARVVEAAAKKVESGAKKIKEALTTREVLANLIPEDPINTYVDVRDVNLIKDPQGNITGFEVLGNTDRFNQDPNKFRTFNSSKSNGVFSQFSKRNGDFSGDPSVFDRYNTTAFVAVTDGFHTNSRVIVMDENNPNPQFIPLNEGRVWNKALFHEAGITILEKSGNGGGEMVILDLNAKTATTLVPPRVDGLRIAASVYRESISADKTKGKVVVSGGKSNGPYGVLEIELDFVNKQVIGPPTLYWPNKQASRYFAYNGENGEVGIDLLWNQDNQELFIGNRRTNQEIKSYITPHIYSAVTDGKNVIATTSDPEGVFLRVWPIDIDPNINPEKVTKTRLLDGVVEPGGEGNQTPNFVSMGYINNELFYLFTATDKGLIAVKANLDGSLNLDAEEYMLAKGILESYQGAPATSTSTPQLENTPTPTPTVTQKVKQVFLPLVNKAHQFLGW